MCFRTPCPNCRAEPSKVPAAAPRPRKKGRFRIAISDRPPSPPWDPRLPATPIVLVCIVFLLFAQVTPFSHFRNHFGKLPPAHPCSPALPRYGGEHSSPPPPTARGRHRRTHGRSPETAALPVGGEGGMEPIQPPRGVVVFHVGFFFLGGAGSQATRPHPPPAAALYGRCHLCCYPRVSIGMVVPTPHIDRDSPWVPPICNLPYCCSI